MEFIICSREYFENFATFFLSKIHIFFYRHNKITAERLPSQPPEKITFPTPFKRNSKSNVLERFRKWFGEYVIVLFCHTHVFLHDFRFFTIIYYFEFEVLMIMRRRYDEYRLHSCRYVRTEMFSIPRDNGREVDRILLIMSDGDSNEPSDTIDQARRLRYRTFDTDGDYNMEFNLYLIIFNID